MMHPDTIRMIRQLIADGATDQEIASQMLDAETAYFDAMNDLEHDDSEWADERRGYGSDSYTCGRNEAGEWRGLM